VSAPLDDFGFSLCSRLRNKMLGSVLLSRARGVTVPDTDAQIAWVREYSGGRY
jgi:hypothetical protein